MKKEKIILAVIIFLSFLTGLATGWFLPPNKETAKTGKEDLIVVDIPEPNDKIESPVRITGQARGYWFFEASFPIRVLDEKGNQLGIEVAAAKSDWMTTDFVPFEALVYFSEPSGEKGMLVLEKDNPSGLPENDDKLEIPIKF